MLPEDHSFVASVSGLGHYSFKSHFSIKQTLIHLYWCKPDTWMGQGTHTISKLPFFHCII